VLAIPPGEAGVQRLERPHVVFVPLPRQPFGPTICDRRGPGFTQSNPERPDDVLQLAQFGNEGRGPGRERVDHVHRDATFHPQVQHAAPRQQRVLKSQREDPHCVHRIGVDLSVAVYEKEEPGRPQRVVPIPVPAQGGGVCCEPPKSSPPKSACHA